MEMIYLLLLLPVTLADVFNPVPIERNPDLTTIAPPIARSMGRDRLSEPPHHSDRRRHHRRRVSSAERDYLRQLEEHDARMDEYKAQQKAQRDQYYQQYFDRMKGYAVETHVRKYNALLAQQQAERERFSKSMREFGVREEDVIRNIGSVATNVDSPAPRSPFGNLHNREEVFSGKPKAEAVPMLEGPFQPQKPSSVEPRPENRELHRKAVALEGLCSRFLPTVRKHCKGNETEEEYVKRCNGFFHDCAGLLPKSDPLYSIANAFSSNVGLNFATVGVKGIPYYPINEEGAIEVGHTADIPFGSWGGGYSQNLGVRDYWSQHMEVGANWYDGKYGYKSGWSVPLVQSLGIEGDTHALVSVPLKPGELGKPIGVDVGGGVGPYYQQNQHVGVDYMNGNVNTNFGVGVPFAGVGVNTGLGIQFPSVNDVMG